MTPSARSANLIAGDGAKNGLPAPNKELATNQKRLLDRKSPKQAACGSLVIALALLAGRVDAGEAFAASQLDESFQIEAWGEDAEQASRRAALAADIEAAARFASLLGA